VLSDLGLEITSHGRSAIDEGFVLRAMDPSRVRAVPHRAGSVAPGIMVQSLRPDRGGPEISVNTGLYTRECTNTAVVGEGVLSVGLATAKDPQRVIADLVTACVDQARFMNAMLQLGAAAHAVLKEVDPLKIAKDLTSLLSLSQQERDSVMRHLIGANDFTMYGLHAAITRSAQDVEKPSRRVQLERLGGKLISGPDGSLYHRLANVY